MLKNQGLYQLIQNDTEYFIHEHQAQNGVKTITFVHI